MTTGRINQVSIFNLKRLVLGVWQRRKTNLTHIDAFQKQMFGVNISELSPRCFFGQIVISASPPR